MVECVRAGIEFVLAGSIRDDGPIVDTITDIVEAQDRYAEALADVGLVIVLSTMLHGIGVGNMLPAWAPVVCVDINPAVVTKLADRGSSQTIGLVTDVGLFLHQLAKRLPVDLQQPSNATVIPLNVIVTANITACALRQPADSPQIFNATHRARSLPGLVGSGVGPWSARRRVAGVSLAGLRAQDSPRRRALHRLRESWPARMVLRSSPPTVTTGCRLAFCCTSTAGSRSTTTPSSTSTISRYDGCARTSVGDWRDISSSM